MPDQVLLITEDDNAREAVTRACAALDATVGEADDAAAAAAMLESGARGPILCAFDAFAALREAYPGLCAIILADRADSEQAIEWMKRGALDYVIKPLKHETLVHTIGEALRVSREVELPAYDDDEDDRAPAERIVGQSPAMQEVFKLIGLVAPRDVNVLVTGESGTGKELVARALRQHSGRKEQPFLAVNCAAIPETLLESELFGHEKGAFTGADVRRVGKFEQCDGGTLFLDEIGDIPLPTQAKLLRVLQDQSFQRLGGNEVLHCDVRIIAATNQPLEKLIAARQFREDLYYRLKVASIDVPPLRDREVDVVLLAHYFVRRFGRQLETQIRRFSPRALPALLNYAWPGNVRELENVIKASLVTARGAVFQPEFLPAHVRESADQEIATPSSESAAPSRPTTNNLRGFAEDLASQREFEGRLHREAVAGVEREVIRACLLRTRGRLAPAARWLGVTRTTLRKKIAELGIKVETDIHLPPDG